MMDLTIVWAIIIAFAVARLPGHGGHNPSEGHKAGPPTTPVELPGVLLAALASIGLGLVTRHNRQRAAQLREVVSQLEQAREQLKEETALLERTRIARELHDIVTHSLGVIAVQELAPGVDCVPAAQGRHDAAPDRS